MKKVWIKNLEKAERTSKIMLCFPYAGGGASIFYSWERQLPSSFLLCPVQLPGREALISEEPYKTMPEVVEDIIILLKNIQWQQMILFGHSMGGKIAYEVTKALEAINKRVDLLIVSACREPHLAEPNPIAHLKKEQFKTALKRFGGTPREILENKSLLEFFMPLLRADFTLDESYCANDQIQLMCPILALAGDKDLEVSLDEIKAWKDNTENQFEYKIFPGGHFFIRENEAKILQLICRKIMNESKNALVL